MLIEFVTLVKSINYFQICNMKCKLYLAGESLDIYQLLEMIDKLKSSNSTKNQKKVSVKAAAN